MVHGWHLVLWADWIDYEIKLDRVSWNTGGLIRR